MVTGFQKHWLRKSLFSLVEQPVDITSLAVFRIGFGLLMSAAMIRFLTKGWVGEFYTTPAFHFGYPGLEWIRPWPDAGMHVHFVVLALLALGVATGLYYRVCAVLFFLGFAYVELIDQTAYLNHYYLISLVSGIMIFLPAHRAWSFDARRKTKIRAETARAWCLNLLRFQIGVVYFFAGLAKINWDWLFQAEPLRIWLAARSDLPFIGPLLGETWVAFAASWFGAVFDLTIVFFLLHRKSRGIAYLLALFFHVATWVLFNIGMFPWIMMLGAALFFPPEWHRQVLKRVSGFLFKDPSPNRWLQDCGVTVPGNPEAPARVSKPLLWILGAYCLVQLALPLRSYFARQPVAWTCSGFNCAWRVMIVEKTGSVAFYACDPFSKKQWKLGLRNYLTPRQEAMMAQDPYLIRAMARRLAADLKQSGFQDVEIRAEATATLNGRPSQSLVDPTINLAAPTPSGWIVTLVR